MRNASEAKERFAKLRQSYNTVLLKVKCSPSTGGGVLHEMGMLMLWSTCVHMDISLVMVHSYQHIHNFD